MTALVWDATGEKVYEGGVDRGVLYIQNRGVAWNGLVSVTDATTDEVTPVHIDGFLIRNLFTIGDLQATLTAYTYPDEFLVCEGMERYNGMYVDSQPPEEFGLSYRTQVGNDVSGAQSSYKIHLLYNLTAVSDTKTYSTLSLDPEPIEFSWSINGRPEEAKGYRPTAHIIIDSKLWPVDDLRAFEEILYGTISSPPYLPTFEDLIAILYPHNAFVVVSLADGEWIGVDLRGDHLSFINDELFEIDAPTVVMVDGDTFDVTTYNTHLEVTPFGRS